MSRACSTVWYESVEMLKTLSNGEGDSEIELPSELTPLDREHLHKMCQKLKLKSKSTDRDSQRVMRVWRKGAKSGGEPNGEVKAPATSGAVVGMNFMESVSASIAHTAVLHAESHNGFAVLKLDINGKRHLAVRCTDPKSKLAQDAAMMLSKILGCSPSHVKQEDPISIKLDGQWPEHFNLAEVLQGEFMGLRVIGIGTNKEKRTRACYIALCILAARGNALDWACNIPDLTPLLRIADRALLDGHDSHFALAENHRSTALADDAAFLAGPCAPQDASISKTDFSEPYLSQCHHEQSVATLEECKHNCSPKGPCKFHFEKKGCRSASKCVFCHDESHRKNKASRGGVKSRVMREQKAIRKDRTWHTPSEEDFHAMINKLTPSFVALQNGLHRVVQSADCEGPQTRHMLERILNKVRGNLDDGVDCASDDIRLAPRDECALSWYWDKVESELCQALVRHAESRSETEDASDDEGRRQGASTEVKASLLMRALKVDLGTPTEAEYSMLESGLKGLLFSEKPTISTVSSCDNVSASHASDWKVRYNNEKNQRATQRASKAALAESSDILDNEGRKFRFDKIVVNIANVGNYGRREDKTATFSWDYVQQALASLSEEYEVIGVMKENLSGMPHEIKAMLGRNLITVPRQLVKPGEKDDLDDHATISAAYRNCCRMLDNDMYRDWMQGKLEDRRVQKWLKMNYDVVKLGYYFIGLDFHISPKAKVQYPVPSSGNDGFQ